MHRWGNACLYIGYKMQNWKCVTIYFLCSVLKQNISQTKIFDQYFQLATELESNVPLDSCWGGMTCYELFFSEERGLQGMVLMGCWLEKITTII